MGRVVVVKPAAFALDGPFDDLWSGVFRVVTFGIEFVVIFLPGSPGWYGAPDARPRLLGPFLVGDLLYIASLY